jgi:hypothetical protein
VGRQLHSSLFTQPDIRISRPLNPGPTARCTMAPTGHLSTGAQVVRFHCPSALEPRWLSGHTQIRLSLPKNQDAIEHPLTIRSKRGRDTPLWPTGFCLNSRNQAPNAKSNNSNDGGWSMDLGQMEQCICL